VADSSASRDIPGPSGGHAVQEPLWRIVADRLRADILDGAIAEGSRLHEIDLAAHFGVSRGPVREALRELVGLGLAVDLPRRGVFVSSATETDIQEVYVAREALEKAAGRLFIRRVHDRDLPRVREALVTMERAYAADDVAGGRALDLEFHRSIFVIAGARRLTAIFDQLAGQTLLLLRSEDEKLPDVAKVSPPEVHRAMADALVARDLPGFEAAVTAHFNDMTNRPFPHARDAAEP
jgi:DNA-binding GntR family transcriptional regulator